VVAGTAEVSRFRLCILFSQIVAGTILRHALVHQIGSVLLDASLPVLSVTSQNHIQKYDVNLSYGG